MPGSTRARSSPRRRWRAARTTRSPRSRRACTRPSTRSTRPPSAASSPSPGAWTARACVSARVLAGRGGMRVWPMDEQVWQELRSAEPSLEAVVFDAGGTLVRLDFEWMREMLADLGITASVDDLRRGEVHGRRRYDSLAGRTPNTPALGLHPPLGSVAPTRAYFSGLLEAVGCRHPVLEEALERMQQRQ